MVWRESLTNGSLASILMEGWQLRWQPHQTWGWQARWSWWRMLRSGSHWRGRRTLPSRSQWWEWPWGRWQCQRRCAMVRSLPSLSSQPRGTKKYTNATSHYKINSEITTSPKNYYMKAMIWFLVRLLHMSCFVLHLCKCVKFFFLRHVNAWSLELSLSLDTQVSKWTPHVL